MQRGFEEAWRRANARSVTDDREQADGLEHASIELLGIARNPPQRRVDLVTRRLGDFIRASVPDVQVSSVLTALLIGDQKRIPVELAAA